MEEVPTPSLRQIALACHRAAEQAQEAAERAADLAADASAHAGQVNEAAERMAELATGAMAHAGKLCHEASRLAVNARYMDLLANATSAACCSAAADHADEEWSKRDRSRSRRAKRQR